MLVVQISFGSLIVQEVWSTDKEILGDSLSTHSPGRARTLRRTASGADSGSSSFIRASRRFRRTLAVSEECNTRCSLSTRRQ